MRLLQVILLAGLMGTLLVRADEPAKPQWQRLLQGDDAKKADEQEKQLAQLQEAAKFEDALKVAEALAELRNRAQGKDHWEAVNARFAVEAVRRALGQSKEARAEYAGTFPLLTEANRLKNQESRFKDAQPLLEKVLAVHRKVLGEEHPDTASSINRLALNQKEQGQYALAEESARKALAIQRKVLGEEHPDTADSYSNLAAALLFQGKYAEADEGHRQALAIRRKVLGEEHADTADAYNDLALNLLYRARYAEALEGFRKSLAIWRKSLGEEHQRVALGYSNVAATQFYLGDYAAAADGSRKALAIRFKVLGEDHLDTSLSYSILALNLYHLGKHVEGEANARKALAIQRKLLGEDHLETATSYNNLAHNLNGQGRYADTEECQRRMLAICRKALGEEHLNTGTAYNNLAINLTDQGRYAEAEELHQRALAIRRKATGPDSPDVGYSYNNLGSNLSAQGRKAEAEPFARQALAVWRKSLGEEHPRTALAYHNLADSLVAQGKYAEAEENITKALAIYRKALGEDHPETAEAYKVVAYSLARQGRHAEAAEVYGKVLGIRRRVLGEEHPRTASSYRDVATNLAARGKYAEAEASAVEAAASFTKGRLRIADTGLGRATKTGEGSPFFLLAATLARNGKPEEAWHRFEEGLARGTWDEMFARLHRPPEEQARQSELLAQLKRLDQLIERAVAVKEPSPEQDQRRKDLLTQRRQAQDELAKFARHLETTYGPAAGQVFERADIQKALPTDTALVGWLDLAAEAKAADPNGEHWAVVLRSAGPPTWVRLRGSGPGESWTAADTQLAADLRAALQSSRGDWQTTAERLRKQRWEPLRPHLAVTDSLPAVRHVLVLPSRALQGVPAEVFTDGCTISYALSGTLYAHQRRQPRVTTTGLLALADPQFDAPTAAEKSLPKSGLLVTVVVPGGNAATAGFQINDVLLRYNGADLVARTDLKTLPESDDADRRVPVTVWRDGKTIEKELRPGKLGVVLADDPAPKALAELRKLDQRLASRGGDGNWEQLPGTRAEVEALRRLFPGDSPPRLLFDSQASEQQLDALARKGELGQYRYLHLATHGEVDDRFPLRSALILSRDALPDPGKQLDAGLPVFDGRLTAEEVLRQWHLKSDLVTLSACQTGLGRYETGEGFVGFAQALILAGSRSVCLSLWKVDDSATALLMDRFYQNLLGRREGLKGPLPKAAALAEAKGWLRALPREEALRQAARLTKGVERGKGRPVQPLLPAVPAAADMGDRPYAHPYYWAAFVLIGDPE
jgi:tetratricopeptide (TPR) repeat protein